MPTTITLPMPIDVLSPEDLQGILTRLDNIEAFLRQAFTLPANAPIMPQPTLKPVRVDTSGPDISPGP